MDDGLAGTPISEQFVRTSPRSSRNIPVSRSSAISTATMPQVPSSRAWPHFSPRTPRSTASCRRATARGAMEALKNADRGQVPIVAAAFNGTGVACAETEGAKCWLGSNPPSLSAEATKLAIDVLDGKAAGRQDACSSTRRADHRPDRRRLCAELGRGEDRARQDRVPRPRTRPVAADLAGLGDDHPAGGRRRLKHPPRPD